MTMTKRKTQQEVSKAFWSNTLDEKRVNSICCVTGDRTYKTLWLHKTDIAYRSHDDLNRPTLFIKTGGWHTETTKAYLDAILPRGFTTEWRNKKLYLQYQASCRPILDSTWLRVF